MPSNLNRKPIFDAAKQVGAKFVTAADVAVLDTGIDQALRSLTPDAPAPAPAPPPTGAPIPIPPKYSLGQTSLSRLVGVKPQLVACVKLAIQYTPQDFRVQQGERTYAEQQAAVASGHSRTMHSKHLPQADGFVWAVDLVAMVAGAVSWEFNRYGAIAWAMDKAATELNIASYLRWGCAWDRVLSDFAGSAQAYLDDAAAYAKRHAGSDLLDAPHFEWVP